MFFLMTAMYILPCMLIILLLVMILRDRKKEYVEINDALLGLEELERHAVEIARSHAAGRHSKSSLWLMPRMHENYKYISDAYKTLNNDVKGMFPTAPAAEWLLDNFYFIEEQIKDILKNNSSKRHPKLPALKGSHLRGYPRVYAIALELVAHTDGRIDEKVLSGFINSYQSQSLLSIGELWSVITMVRIALIENLRHICGEIIESQQQWDNAEKLAELLSNNLDKSEYELLCMIKGHIGNSGNVCCINPSFIEHLLQKLRKQGGKISPVIHYLDAKLAEQDSSAEIITGLEHQVQAARQVSMGNTITSLKLVSTVDWTDMFESLCHVEKILRQDPYGIYPQMDFESRNHYRCEVEKLANIYGASEIHIARKVIKCADEGETSPLNHAGYYLIGKGRKCLERKIGYKSTWYRAIAGIAKKNSPIIYISSITMITLFITACFVYYAWKSKSSFSAGIMLLAGLVVLIPASELAVAFINSIVSHIFRPYIFPKLELREGIPASSSTMVIIPTLLPDAKRVKELVKQLEVFYLANKENNLFFALVGDYKDAPHQNMAEDEKITDTALEGIKTLNERYSDGKCDIFYYFNRHRQYNTSQGKWMGWERKRGAITELNDLLRGNDQTTYSITSRELQELPYIRYVITLDADTSLPIGTAKRMTGTISHPLNMAVIDEKAGLVIDGYGLLQPRITVSILHANNTLFSRIFAGQGGIDPYTTAISDVYQDLFGEGIFTGKGIYDVDVFRKVLKNAIPDNTVLSHDLLEGCFVRAGLVTDIELVDGYPPKYNSFAMRLHRWVRGDWQLLPWLAPVIRDKMGNRAKNPLSSASKWKILDNMRRSILNPSLFILITLSLGILPGNSLIWMGFALVTASIPVLIYVFNAILSMNFQFFKEGSNSTVISGLRAAFYQTGLMFAFIPYQAYLMVDAILRTLARVLFTKRNLLEWVTAADMEANLKNDLNSFCKRMWASLLLSIFVFSVSVMFSPGTLHLAVLLFAIWSAAPFIAYDISKVFSSGCKELDSNDLLVLRRLARKTWKYFEDFTVREENYLPPDNYQEDPPKGVAHRTSPTNIGLYLASVLSARDLGYIGTVEMVERLCNTVTMVEKLEKWRGHLYNWYDTRTMKILRPSYVSTVDSGNFIGYLMVLEEGLREYIKKPLLDINMVYGIRDTINLLKEEKKEADMNIPTLPFEHMISKKEIDIRMWPDVLDNLLSHMSRTSAGYNMKYKSKSLLWENKLSSMVSSFRKEVSDLIPFFTKRDDDSVSVISDILYSRSCDFSLCGLAEYYNAIINDGNLSRSEKSSVEIADARGRIVNEINKIEDLIIRIRTLIKATTFTPLYDSKRQLFSIGYNVEEGHLSKSYYDLLASEARQASFIAIARGEIDKKHWFRLGRALTIIDRFKGLASWTGTMFEYLMPFLIIRNYENTLIDETYSFVVRNQKKYGRKRRIPWGTSESGYNAFDINLNYQYKAFGVPGLGLKRRLENDIVVAPYASILALGIDSAGVVENIKKLEEEGLDGAYGFYEAVDYTPSRLRRGRKSSIIKSFMAHHQGMSFIALNNSLNGNIMQERFHADPMIKSAELLLQERIPMRVMFAKERKGEYSPPLKKPEQEDGEVIRTTGIPDSQLPHVHILSNGCYSVMVTNSGSGYSKMQGTSITRWRENPAGSSTGMFIFIQNINTNKGWSSTFEPYNVTPDRYKVVFSPDKAEFTRKDDTIDTHTEITVSPEDNTEIRRISLTNRSHYPRTLEVTSYFEVVLTHPDADMAHPVFSNLFVKTEYIPEQECLLASRRPRCANQKQLWAIHTVAAEGELIGGMQYETDRMKFIGRNRDLSNPIAMETDQPLTNTTGAVLDPVMSLRRRVKVEPGQTIRIAFMVGVADTRENALELAEKYNDLKASDRAFELSWTRSQVESRYLGFKASEVLQYLDMIPHLIFISHLRRKWSELILKNKKGCHELWSFGISGTNPVVLVQLDGIDQIELVYWILKAHEYWKMKGLCVDLLLLMEDENSYTQPLYDMIRDAVSASHARDIQDKAGGVFVRNAKLITEEEKTLLYAAACIALKGGAGLAAEQLNIEKKGTQLPRFLICKLIENKSSDNIEEAYPAHIISQSGLEFFNGIGGFTKDNKEYVICLREKQTTPAPWVNVIANQRFGFLVSETGSGYTWSENSHENRLTPWYNDPVSDPGGEVFYVRDDHTGYFWSITPLPIREREPYIIRHGQGYSVFQHSSNGIEQELTEFVPVDDPVKVCIIRLKNISETRRDLTVTYYIRPVLGVNDRTTAQHTVTRFHNETGMLLMTNAFNSDFSRRIAFVCTSEKECSYTGDRWEFVGTNGSLDEPESMKREKLSDRTGAGFNPCAAIQVRLGMNAGEAREIVFLLGQGKNIEEAIDFASKYRDISRAKDELDKIKKIWEKRLESIQVHTPDASMDIMLNGWLLYQVISCRLWARSAFYQSGGAYGFRDQLQDIMAVMYTCPELARSQILLHSTRQFIDGDVQHWWHQDTGKGVRTRYSDDLLWLPYVTADYIRNTGDWKVLDEETAYLESEPLCENEDERYDKPCISENKASLYEHCILAIDKALKFGEHGIPLMGAGDWNDGMNTVGNQGRGESVWLGWFLYTVLKEFVTFCLAHGDAEKAGYYEGMAEMISESIEKNAWDGSWYRRAYFDDGTPLGSAQNTECRIDSISQSWSVISGAGKPHRMEEAINAVENHLIDREEGIIKLLTPYFDEGCLQPGYIKGYVPGVRENGGQYTHAAAWVILALAKLGKGDKAYELYHLINPINHSRTPIEYARYKVEPYVIAADVYAVHPYIGRGGWTWYTGAASWMYRVGVENILGIKKYGDGLYIDPCIPREWDGYKVTYRFGKSVYIINIRNPERVNRGVKSNAMDGKMCGEGVIYLVDDGTEHVIEVVMG